MSRFCAVTDAADTAAPDGSLTKPDKLPVTWAEVEGAEQQTSSKAEIKGYGFAISRAQSACKTLASPSNPIENRHPATIFCIAVPPSAGFLKVKVYMISAFNVDCDTDMHEY